MVLFLGLIDLPHTHIRMVFQEGVKHGLQAFHSGSGGCRMLFKESFPLAMVS